MTKKDFEAVARAMAAAKPEGNGTNYQTWVNTVRELAKEFETINSRFNHATFSVACGAPIRM